VTHIATLRAGHC